MRKLILFSLAVITGALLAHLSLPRRGSLESASSTPALTSTRPITSVTELYQHVNSFRQSLKTSEFTLSRCDSKLSEFSAPMRDVTPSMILALPNSERSRTATVLVERLFKLRLNVGDKLASLSDGKLYPADCLQSLREFIRITRLAEDGFAEAAAQFPDYAETAVALTGSSPEMLTRTQNAKFELQSGDVFIARGKTFTGAAIGRMSDTDSSFSHMGLIYVDEQGATQTIESFMEKGVEIFPLTKFEKPDKARYAVYRHRDRALAARAAKFMYDEVNLKASRGEAFAYDFHMDASERSALYCSEVVEHAFESAAHHPIQFSESTITATNRDFFDRFGVTGTHAFLPSDIEVDPSFVLVAEWRDTARTNDARMKDSVLSAVFNWMESDRYVLHDPMKVRFRSFVAQNLRSWPLFSSYLKTRVPKAIPPRALGAFLTLHEISAAIYLKLAAANLDFRTANQRWMSDPEMMAFLEKLKVEDLKNYQKAKSGSAPRASVIFHDLFRAKD